MTTFPKMPVNVSRLPTLGTMIKLRATPKDFPALLAHMGLAAIDNFSANLKFRPWAKDGVQIEGELLANVETQCPLTTKPVAQEINANFKAKFAPASSKLAKPRINEDGEMLLDFESDDIPDIYEGDELDAWEIAVEYLLLEIDAFARAPGAEFSTDDAEPIEEDDTQSPFAALKSLKSE